jgi:protein ImuB
MATSSRIAALYIPAWPLEALLRAEPDLRGQPVAVLDAPPAHPRARVLHASAEARTAGIRAGLAASQARAILGTLIARVVSPEILRSAAGALADVAAAFSALVEPGAEGEGVVLCEVGDLGRLFASERELATALWAHATRLGLCGHVAIAATPAQARVLARAHQGVTVVPAGQERAALGALPLGALAAAARYICDEANMFEAALAALARFGLTTVGELAALPRRSLGPRLGAAGVALHRLAAAEDESTLHPRPASDELREAIELDDPLDNLEALAFVLRGLLDRLCARLGVRGWATPDVTLRLALYPRGHDERTLALAAPTRHVPTILELLRLALAAVPPAESVRGVSVACAPTRPRPAQLALFSRRGPSPDKLATTLARLDALCAAPGGEPRVGRPVLVDSHVPGAFAVQPFSAPSVTTSRAAAPATPLAPHCLRPPRGVEVHLSGGTPAFLRGDSIAGRIVEHGGPYRLTAGLEAPVARDYYDVELDCGLVFRLFLDLRGGGWFLDARYE